MRSTAIPILGGYARVGAKRFALAAVIALSACVASAPMAPGAEQVRLTRNPSDVTGCKALGNFDQEGGTADSARNHAVGLGGDTVLDTTPKVGNPAEIKIVTSGIIYRCAK